MTTNATSPVLCALGAARTGISFVAIGAGLLVIRTLPATWRRAEPM